MKTWSLQKRCDRHGTYTGPGCPKCEAKGIIEHCGPWDRRVFHDGTRNIFAVFYDGFPRFQSVSAYDATEFYAREVLKWKQS